MSFLTVLMDWCLTRHVRDSLNGARCHTASTSVLPRGLSLEGITVAGALGGVLRSSPRLSGK